MLRVQNIVDRSQAENTMKPISRYLDDAIDSGLSKNDSETARKIGVTRAAVSDWRVGRRAPDDDQAVKLAELLGKDPGELLAECGAARAKTPETRRAWERVAARMAASGITACALIMSVGQTPDAQASAGQTIDNLSLTVFRSARRYILRLLSLVIPSKILKQFRHLNIKRPGQPYHRIGRNTPAMGDVTMQCGVRYA